MPKYPVHSPSTRILRPRHRRANQIFVSDLIARHALEDFDYYIYARADHEEDIHHHLPHSYTVERNLTPYGLYKKVIIPYRPLQLQLRLLSNAVGLGYLLQTQPHPRRI